MELIKIVVVGIVISILAVFLKQVKPEYSVICIVAGSILLLLYILYSISDIFNFFSDIVNKTGIDNNLFLTIVKVIGIGYLIEFSANICNDSGNSAIADKVVLAGKILIFTMSLPIVSSLFNMVMDLI